MQLPVTGHPLHTRSLTMVVSLREDGFWDARGDMIDLRKCGFVPMSSDIQPAGIVHLMSIELSVDPRARRIESVETDQPFVAIEPSAQSRGECCRDPAPRLRAFEGDTLDPGFARRLGAGFGGPLGCSHLLTLFQLMASGLIGAFDLEDALGADRRSRREPGERLFRRAAFVDGLEAPDGSTELVVQLSDFHTEPGPQIANPLARLADEADARVFARVESPGMSLRDVRLAARRRSWKELGDADWVDSSDRLRDLEGAPIIPGLAHRLFASLGREPEDRHLLDACLQLAPAHIQVLAATMDRWFAQGAAGPERPGTREAPEVGQIGGMPDSCYMWRSDGPLVTTRFAPGRSNDGS